MTANDYYVQHILPYELALVTHYQDGWIALYETRYVLLHMRLAEGVDCTCVLLWNCRGYNHCHLSRGPSPTASKILANL